MFYLGCVPPYYPPLTRRWSICYQCLSYHTGTLPPYQFSQMLMSLSTWKSSPLLPTIDKLVVYLCYQYPSYHTGTTPQYLYPQVATVSITLGEFFLTASDKLVVYLCYQYLSYHTGTIPQYQHPQDDRLVGQVVKWSASKAGDAGFDYRGRFSWSSPTSGLTIGTAVATLPGA